MGRKPNAIVSEFFSRGAKLHDSSNRYEHTCKLCGQIFPKGRADSLLSHLIRTCQAISTADRERVEKLWPAQRGTRRMRTPRASQVTNPYLLRQTSMFNAGIGGLNGLNVLAEASRQVGASDDQHPEHPESAPEEALNISTEAGAPVIPQAKDQKPVLVDPALEAVTKPNIDLDLQSVLDPSPSSKQLFPNSTETADAPSLLTDNLLGTQETEPDAPQSSRLSLIAASANEMVPQEGLALESNVPLMLYKDPLGGMYYQAPDGADAVLEPSTEQQQTQDSDFDTATQRAAMYPRPIAMQPNSPSPAVQGGSGETLQSGKNKSRSQFSEARRKEVQIVRQKGACLRCRMLKKTCSAGDPCDQCKGIQNPRVWMECCIRTRLTAQLSVYTAGLQNTLAYRRVRDLKQRLFMGPFPGRAEISCFDSQPPQFFSFDIQMSTGGKELNPEVSVDGHLSPMGNVYILDSDFKEVDAIVESYLQAMARNFYEDEPSPLIKSTVLLCSELHEKEEDELLSGVLQLWVATRVIADPRVAWRITLHPKVIHPSFDDPEAQTQSEYGFVCIDQVNEPESYMFITTQIRSAAEKYASKQIRTVLNKIETRLLQKQRSGHFRTFLGTLLVLNCVERMTWLYKTWEQNETEWPLDNGPTYFANQGERFSGIVDTHLRMRSLAPRSVIGLEDHVLRALDSPDKDIARWFSAMSLSYDFLKERPGSEFDPMDCRSFDFKFASRIFRPPENAGLFA